MGHRNRPTTSLISYETANKIATTWNTGKYNTCVEAVSAAMGKEVKTRNAFAYRRAAEEILGIELKSLTGYGDRSIKIAHPERIMVDLPQKAFVVLATSDHHYTTRHHWDAHDIACKIADAIKPDMMLIGGDALNGDTISRYGRTGWEEQEPLADEYGATSHYTEELRAAARKPGKKLLLKWLIGNHDHRIEKYLSSQAPMMEGMPGTTLEELFPRWDFSWSMQIGDMIFKHRWHNGIHAAYNNVLRSGVNMYTGHLHRMHSVPYTDYRGTRWAYEGGTLAEPGTLPFEYLEHNPANWQTGFWVFTFEGDQIAAESIRVEDGRTMFRGKVYKA